MYIKYRFGLSVCWFIYVHREIISAQLGFYWECLFLLYRPSSPRLNYCVLTWFECTTNNTCRAFGCAMPRTYANLNPGLTLRIFHTGTEKPKISFCFFFFFSSSLTPTLLCLFLLHHTLRVTPACLTYLITPRSHSVALLHRSSIYTRQLRAFVIYCTTASTEVVPNGPPTSPRLSWTELAIWTTGKLWIYRLLFVCLFVCTVTDFSGDDKASGVKFCRMVHVRPGQGTWLPQKPKIGESARPPGSKVS